MCSDALLVPTSIVDHQTNEGQGDGADGGGDAAGRKAESAMLGIASASRTHSIAVRQPYDSRRLARFAA